MKANHLHRRLLRRRRRCRLHHHHHDYNHPPKMPSPIEYLYFGPEVRGIFPRGIISRHVASSRSQLGSPVDQKPSTKSCTSFNCVSPFLLRVYVPRNVRRRHQSSCCVVHNPNLYQHVCVFGITADTPDNKRHARRHQ